MRAILGQTIINFSAPDAETPLVALNRTRTFFDHWAGHPLVTAAVAPHAPNTLASQYLQDAAELARKYENPILIHLAETQDEYNKIQVRHSLSEHMFVSSTYYTVCQSSILFSNVFLGTVRFHTC